MNPGFGVRVALNAHGLARTFASAGIRGCSLTAHGKTTQMADAAVTLDGLEAFEVQANFAAQIAFSDVFTLLNGVNDLGKLLFVEVFGADRWIDRCAVENDLGIGRANSIDVTQGNINAFVTGNIDAEKSWHKE
jgi:hypothetical protein